MIITGELPDLEHEILRTIAYFDVFAYPLTKTQLHSFLAYHATTELELEKALQVLVQTKLIRSSQDYYYSSTRRDGIVTDRLENERRASRMLRYARWISFFLKHVPFVRAVFITGSLSKHVAPHKSDIDFMIVTEFNRLWICKMILTGFRRIFLFNSKKYFCINLMVTENGMYFPNHNYFTAVEIATTQVVWNTTAFMKYQNENAWIHQYLPNWQSPTNGMSPLLNTPVLLQSLFESALNILHLDALNTNLMQTARNFWRRKHKSIDETKFNSIIQCTPDISSVWHDDHQTTILVGFQKRLTAYGIKEAA
jgi:hypothetical protein